MKIFRVQFCSGRIALIKADEFEILFNSNTDFKEGRFRIKGVGVIAKVNMDRVELIEEVRENE